MDTIKRVAGRAAFDALVADNAFDFSLSNFPWGSEPMTVRASLRHDGEYLYAAMRCFEKSPRATVTQHEGDVHFDSCLEFFFSPCPALRPDYFNMEANPNGAMKFNYGEGRHGRIKTHDLPPSAGMRATVTDEYWELVYQIPYSLIRKFAPEFTGAPGSVIHVNMYRCGESAAQTSFVTLYPVGTATPDYHRPEYFQPMEIE